MATGGASMAAGGVDDAGGVPGAGGATQAVCELERVVGPCFASMARYAFNVTSGRCELFTYGGCGGNENNFETQVECEEECGAPPACPSHLQTSTVYEIHRNGTPSGCIDYARPQRVGCSILLQPSLTVPTNWGVNFCVRNQGKLFAAGSTLPKSDGWEDCSATEVEAFNAIPDCAAL
jgi:hypothetical protein